MSKKTTTKPTAKKREINFDRLKDLLSNTEQDVASFNKGTQAPASRIRKVLQELIITAKQARKDIIEIKNARRS